jgi:sulfate adenylyltransferase subunit 2
MRPSHPPTLTASKLTDEFGWAPRQLVLTARIDAAARAQRRVLFVQLATVDSAGSALVADDPSGTRTVIDLDGAPETQDWTAVLRRLNQAIAQPITVFPHGAVCAYLRGLSGRGDLDVDWLAYVSPPPAIDAHTRRSGPVSAHLHRLEAESIHIIREAVAEAQNPAMLYSIGKDSAVMLHLARKAFFPATLPFPLLHVDTRWKFRDMYQFRDAVAAGYGLRLIVHTNPEAIARDINPFDHGSALHTDITKTEGLKQALEHYRFDLVFGGARRDEEKSRAKERIFSVRSASHRWDPKNQRPELWSLYNTRLQPGQSVRVFPLSNWTELDVWQYIHQEAIPVVPLYFAASRPVVRRDGTLLMVDDDRFRLQDSESIEALTVRFRTLGCYPLSGAIESTASTVADIILELATARQSERQGRMIDKDGSASMERKKQEGYF